MTHPLASSTKIQLKMVRQSENVKGRRDVAEAERCQEMLRFPRDCQLFEHSSNRVRTRRPTVITLFL